MPNLNFPGFNPYLAFSVPPLPTPLPPPPAGTERHLIGPPGSQLEVLSAHPPPGTPVHRGPPIILQHGGFCSSLCWTRIMPYLAARGHRVYAPSLRGHGLSWRPSWLRMLLTSRDTLAREDLASAVRWVREREGGADPVLVGHSAGGGLSQYSVDQGLLGHIEKLVLVAAFPPFGGVGVYWSWMVLLDPWAIPRMLLHLMHPRSPLSSTTLVRGAFFSATAPEADVRELETELSIVESTRWPSAMMTPFVDTERVLSFVGDRSRPVQDRVLVIAGGEDRLMRPQIMRRAASVYGASYEEIKGSGHHIMRDQYWEVMADKLARFIEA